jgi:hypothetical protein
VWFYYALLIPLNFSPAWLAAGLGLTLYMGAFLHRDLSIGCGQRQAGRVFGMTYAQLMRRCGARPDVHELDRHRRDLSPPKGLHERGSHLFHDALTLFEKTAWNGSCCQMLTQDEVQRIGCEQIRVLGLIQRPHFGKVSSSSRVNKNGPVARIGRFGGEERTV